MSAISPSAASAAAFAADLPQALADLLHLALDGLKRIIADESQPARERRLAAATALQYIARAQVQAAKAAPRAPARHTPPTAQTVQGRASDSAPASPVARAPSAATSKSPDTPSADRPFASPETLQTPTALPWHASLSAAQHLARQAMSKLSPPIPDEGVDEPLAFAG